MNKDEIERNRQALEREQRIGGCLIAVAVIGLILAIGAFASWLVNNCNCL